MPVRYRFKRIEPLAPNVQVDVLHGDEQKMDETFFATEFNPGPGKRYALSVEVGDLPPKEVFEHVSRLKEQLKGFFPEGSMLIIPCRNSHPAIGIYELEVES